MLKTRITENLFRFTDLSIFDDDTNAYVFLTEVGPIVIDTIGDPKHFKTIMDFIRENGYEKPSALIYTHGHLDHILLTRDNIAYFPVYAHNSSFRVINEGKSRVLSGLIRAGKLFKNINVVYPNITFENEIRINAGSYSFILIHTPGHTPDSLTVFEEKTNMAFTGDNMIIIDRKLLVPKLDYANGYIESLNEIRKLNPGIILSGHGEEIESGYYFTTFDEYLKANLHFAEKAVLEKMNIAELDVYDIFDPDLLDKIYNPENSIIIENLLSAYQFFLNKTDI